MASYLMFQMGTVWSDGSEGVTQCPILPGETFMYKFVVDKVLEIFKVLFISI